MKTVDLNYEQVKHLALKCPIKLPKSDGSVAVKSGAWLAYPAQNEVVKRYTRAAKNDLRERELRGGSYAGDLGKVVIGGKTFHYYPVAKALIRQDFANWMDANADKFIKKDGGFKDSNAPLHTADLEPISVNLHVIKAKDRAKNFKKPACLMHEGNWNTLYDMLRKAREYTLECQANEMSGSIAAITLIQRDLLLGLCSYRERNYKASVDALLNVAAFALQAAEFVCNTHSKQKASCGAEGGAS